MQDLTEGARHSLAEIAARNGVSTGAAETLLRAVAAGGGSMAQFSHPELGGMGQWSQGGMIMVGDMFNSGLKHRVDALCQDLAALLRGGPVFAAPAPAAAGGAATSGFGGASSGNWWPDGLGWPSTSGAQNDMAYAYFPAAQRLAVRLHGQVRLYDTTGFSIGGVSQQQGSGWSMSFSTDRGSMSLLDMPLIGG